MYIQQIDRERGESNGVQEIRLCSVAVGSKFTLKRGRNAGIAYIPKV